MLTPNISGQATIEWDWTKTILTLDNGEQVEIEISQRTTYTVGFAFYAGKYSGPYEDSYPDEADWDILSFEGDEPEEWVDEQFMEWFGNEDWSQYC